MRLLSIIMCSSTTLSKMSKNTRRSNTRQRFFPNFSFASTMSKLFGKAREQNHRAFIITTTETSCCYMGAFFVVVRSAWRFAHNWKPSNSNSVSCWWLTTLYREEVIGFAWEYTRKNVRETSFLQSVHVSLYCLSLKILLSQEN